MKIQELYQHLDLLGRQGGLKVYSTQAFHSRFICLTNDEDYNECFDAAKTGIIHIDEAGIIKNLNREAEKICAVERTNILGKTVEIAFQELGSKFLKIFAFPECEDHYTVNLKLTIKDKISYIHANSLKLRDKSGNVGGTIVIMQDVSSVWAAVKQIQTTQMLLSLGELAAGVAHHVRTPLTTLSGYLQVMLNRLEDNQYTVRKDILESLLGEVSYINNVVKELILFAKPPIAREPGVEINNVIDNALFLVFKEMGGEKITIDKQLAENLPSINADENLLSQAVVNIMQNALEAMPETGTLSIRSWLHSDMNMLVIAVADTGTGVSPDILPKVFEPFYSTKLDRLGLGLPVAYRIVAEHGGFININADQDRGAEVHIYLPIVDDRVRQITIAHQQILNLQ